MDVINIIVVLVGVIAGILVTILVGWFFYFRGRLDKYKDKINELESELGKREGGESGPLSLEAIATETKSLKIRHVIEKKTEILASRIIELSVQEISPIWSGMFAERNIIYLRATSLISPSMWKDPWMSRYEGEQRANIDYFNSLEEKEKGRYNQIISSLVPNHERELGSSNFERIFIITKDQSGNAAILIKLIELICSQSEYMDVRIAYEGSILSHRRDFGLTVSRDEDILLYDLIPNIGGDSLLGGRLILNKKERAEAISCYGIVRANSLEIPRGAQSNEVAKIINEVVGEQVDLDAVDRAWEDQKRKKSHKCIGCFIDSEKRVKEDWKALPPARSRWYEMIDVENRKVRDYVLEHKPRRILEVGCGPGRMIDILEKIGFENFDKIVGIEKDTEMYNHAYKRWQENQNVEIFQMTVEHLLPFSDDDFDLCVNAMNIVGWQEDESEWLELMLRCSQVVFFTLYKKGFEADRIEMYEKRGHKLSETAVHKDLKNGQIILGDCAVIPNVVSKAYTYAEVLELCRKVKYDINYDIDDKSNELLYICFISKK